MIAGISQPAAPSISEDLDLFFGDANPAEARVYARLNLANDATRSAPVRIEGHVTGPSCRFAKTLPASIPFADRGPGLSPLAEAVIPDPCFWTPETPFLYHVKLLIHIGDRQESFERLLGIRRLGIRERSLYLDGRRWVARGAVMVAATEGDLPAAREAQAVLFVKTADDSFCAESSSLGAPLIVDLTGCQTNIDAEVRRLSRWPAVFAVVLDATSIVSDNMRKRSPNLLLAARIAADQPVAAPGWAQLIVCPLDCLPELCDWSKTRDWQLPIIVVRPSSSESSGMDLQSARRMCDRLQSDVADLGDFAGYMIELQR